MNKATIMLSVAAISVITLTGCFDNSDDRYDTINGPTAIFKDSLVVGLPYTCKPSNITGTTTVEGKVTCNDGDKAEFHIGAMTIGPVSVRENDVITPYRFYPDNNEAALNIAQLLQSLDDDGDYDIAITLTDTTLAAVSQDLDPESATFDTDADAMLQARGISLVSQDDAAAHLNDAIADTIAPVVTLQGEVEVTINQGDSYTDAGATAVDNIHGTMTPMMSGEVDTAVAGTYTITWTATDAAGNVGTAVRTVIVAAVIPGDTVPPVVTLNGDAEVTITVGATYTDAGATATDNVDGEITPVMSGNVDTTTAGTYTITWTATDVAGNIGTATRTVIVVESQLRPTTPEELEASDIGDSCIDENLNEGVVAKIQDPFGNIIPGTATCEAEEVVEPTSTTPEELEASEIGDSCIDADLNEGVVAKIQDPFGNPIPGTATCSVAN